MSKSKPSELSASGSDSESDYSSSDVTEDEVGDELTPALDAAILRTLSKIKKKEGVYGTENVLQEELKRAQEQAEARGIKTNVVRKVADKPYLLADYHRAKLLSGETADYDEDEEPTEPLTHVQSERLLKQEAVSAFKSLADDSDDEGDFVTKREKDEEEVEQDEEEYRRFLLDVGGGEAEVRKVLGMGDQPVTNHLADDEEEEPKKSVLSTVEKEEMAAKKKAKKEKKAKDDDEFLMNYILNRGWIDRTEQHVPTYKEIVGDDAGSEDATGVEIKPSKARSGSPSHPWGQLDEEDDFEEKAEQFETEYNFRFEEPGSSSIVSHPRLIPSLVRRPDDARKTKRARRAERKAAERAAQEEELRARKGSKRREMEKRMASLKADLAGEGVEGGVDWDQLEKVLDGEWNEAEWEKVVGGMLSAANAEEAEDENGKPIWDDDLGDAEYDEVEEEDGDGYPQGEEGMDLDGAWGEEAEDGPINMDADFLEEEPSKKKRRKGKKDKTRKGDNRAEVPAADEPDLTVVDKAQAVKEAMEEYRALDHEDMIGDLPTRFKYTQTAPTAYGLTPAEILLATDEELNTIFSVKTIAPYRKGGVGIQGKGLGKRVRELKDHLKRRRWGQEDKPWKESKDDEIRRRQGEQGEGKRAGKRKGKKERMRNKKPVEATE